MLQLDRRHLIDNEACKKGGFIYFLGVRTELGDAFLLPVKRNFDSQFATIFLFQLSSSPVITDEEQKKDKRFVEGCLIKKSFN